MCALCIIDDSRMSRAFQLSCLRATTIVVVVTRSIWNEIISAPFNLGALVELQKAHIRAHVHWIPNCIRTSSALLSPCLRCATPFSEWIVVRRRLNACIMMKPEQKANDRHKNLFFWELNLIQLSFIRCSELPIRWIVIGRVFLLRWIP